MYLQVIEKIKIKWHITGFDNYAFGENKKLYNLLRGKEVKQKVNGGSIGWWLGKKFITQKSMKPLLTIPKYFDVPF